MIFFLIISFALIQTIIRLNRHGTSQDLRTQIKWRYIAYWLVLIPEYAHYYARCAFQEYQTSEFSLKAQIIVCNLLIVQALVRLSDPFIRKEFLSAINCKKRALRYSSAPRNSFLNSAINIEFVYLILTGINITIGQAQKDDVESTLSEKSIRVKRNGNRTMITIKDIFLDNKNLKWNISNRSYILNTASCVANNTMTHISRMESINSHSDILPPSSATSRPET